MGLVQQIRSAQLELRWSTQYLLDKSGLPIERSNLHRKLLGKSPTTDAEIQALAAAIKGGNPKFRLIWPERKAG